MKRIFSIGFGIVILGLLSLYFILDPSDYDFFPKCPLHSATGIYCPGCGSQRALHSLLHLNIAGVVGHNLLFFPALITLGYHYGVQILTWRDGRERKTPLNHRWAPWIILTIVLLFWLLRNLPFYPFELLAPN